MTIELTHEQAAVIRVGMMDAEVIQEANLLGLTSGHPTGYQSMPAGREALDAYDAKWAVVERVHIEELRDTAKAVVDEHAKIYSGYPSQMAKIECTLQALSHVTGVLDK